MRRLPIPEIKTYDVFSAAISAFDEPQLKERLTASRTAVADEELRYRCHAEEGRLDLLKQSTMVNADITVAEMKAVYKEGMSAATSAGRAYYDKLMRGAQHGTCPLCGQGKVRNLDHHLPQSRYPALVVTPINLVPACRDCNMAKVTAAPRSESEQTIHPYFDDFTHERWLYARVEKGDPPALLYEVRLPAGWQPVVADRLRRHLKVFKLEATFTLYAAEELSQIADELMDLHDAGGASEVKKELLTRAIRRERSHKNSWQTAMLYALAESDWFCEEGLKKLSPTLTRFSA